MWSGWLIKDLDFGDCRLCRVHTVRFRPSQMEDRRRSSKTEVADLNDADISSVRNEEESL